MTCANNVESVSVLWEQERAPLRKGCVVNDQPTRDSDEMCHPLCSYETENHKRFEATQKNTDYLKPLSARYNMSMRSSIKSTTSYSPLIDMNI